MADHLKDTEQKDKKDEDFAELWGESSPVPAPTVLTATSERSEVQGAGPVHPG